MQTFLKLLAVLFILVPKYTASSSLPKEILNYTELLEDQIRNVNLDEELNSTKAYIAPVENQLRQCGEMEEKIMLLELQINETNKANQQLDEYKNQIEKQGAEIKSISIKDELIASQKAEIEDKLILLEMQINKTNKANEQIEDYKNQIQKKEREIENLSNNNGIVASQRAEIEDKTKLLEDYQLQIAKKELEIKNLQSNLKKPKIICPHDMVKSYEENKMLKSEVQNLNDKIQQLENEQNEENKMLKSEVQNLNDKIQQLKNEKNECELTIKNLDQLNDELGDQEESCQMDLESERFDSNEKDVTIDDMKKEAEANRKLLVEKVLPLAYYIAEFK
ncbi:uncharacterized protein LOC132792339 isoform X2 [Drosophila nasuta]|uniref:uncharacterized protein LOC132792339 isoform X2 n=1 Tax=Drosophila nasuta TaxID=42062 RepID=UPI00295F5AC4|nr:uncharacterized protein LOC132792339 isoform X2 [Drosophila nasuta]